MSRIIEPNTAASFSPAPRDPLASRMQPTTMNSSRQISPPTQIALAVLVRFLLMLMTPGSVGRPDRRQQCADELVDSQIGDAHADRLRRLRRQGGRPGGHREDGEGHESRGRARSARGDGRGCGCCCHPGYSLVPVDTSDALRRRTVVCYAQGYRSRVSCVTSYLLARPRERS